MAKLIASGILAVGSILLVALSWRSFRPRRLHGFFRFFAFEAILCLVVLNARHWFSRAGTPRQLVSWLLLGVSFSLAIHGFHYLRLFGKPQAPTPGAPTYRFENTTVLVTAGAFRYIRHPLYASLLFGVWGAVLKAVSLPSVGLGIIATAFLAATAKAEEAESVDRFGSSYRQYMSRTRRFIPFVW